MILSPSFYSELSSFSLYVWHIIVSWWWVPLPFWLRAKAEERYLDFITNRWDGKTKRILLEIRIPEVSLKSIKAMDQVISSLHGIHDSPTPKEKWVEGVCQQSIAFEIAGIEGVVHFFVRVPEPWKGFVEAAFYAQYPDAEISQVDDYTKNVPQNIPNKEWKIWGVEFIAARNELYPIKTYPKFEVGREIKETGGKSMKEEERVDPLASLLESMSSLGPGEQMWIQYLAKPVMDKNYDWVTKSKKLVDKLSQRPEKEKVASEVMNTFDEARAALYHVIVGKKEEKSAKEEKKEIFSPEMKLTPGERELLTCVEEKMGKFGFVTTFRAVYIAKKGVFFKPRVKGLFGFSKSLSLGEYGGGFKPWSPGTTKVKSIWIGILDKRRLYIRERRKFRYFTKRYPGVFPRSKAEGGQSVKMILNTEELATLFHFPGKIAAPAAGVAWLEQKKGEAPPELPVE